MEAFSSIFSLVGEHHFCQYRKLPFKSLFIMPYAYKPLQYVDAAFNVCILHSRPDSAGCRLPYTA